MKNLIQICLILILTTGAFNVSAQSSSNSTAKQEAKEKEYKDLERSLYHDADHKGAALACEGNNLGNGICIAHNRRCNCDDCYKKYLEGTKAIDAKYEKQQ